MNNRQGSCQIQGHERYKLSCICISNICDQTFRLMCVECVKKNMHNHDDEYYKPLTEFVEYFKNSRLPQLEFRVQQQKGNQVKCDYLEKIYVEFSKLEQELNYSNLKKQYECIEEFSLNLVIIKQAIQEYIVQLKNEIVKAQNINDIYQQLPHTNLDSLNYEWINYLLENHCQFFEKEIQSQEQINNLLNIFNFISLNNPNDEFLLNISLKVKQLSSKLVRINKYINFYTHDQFLIGYQPFRDQISQQGRYFAQQYTNKQSSQDRLLIRDLISKKLIQQHFFNSVSQVRVKFDNKWKYFVTWQNENLFYYDFSKYQIKLIRKFNMNTSISQIQFTNFNQVMVTSISKEQQIQLIDFQLRKINIQSGDARKKFLSSLYGVEKQIIVTLVLVILKKSNSIYIYKKGEIKPFIIRNHIKKHEQIERFQMKLFNQDSQLLTSNELIINSWQIDYKNQNLFLTKTIEDTIHIRDLYQLQQFYIIKKSKKKSSHIEILDQNFNLWFTIQLKTPYYFHDHVHISNQTLLYTDQGKYIVLTRARSDYEQLEQ